MSTADDDDDDEKRHDFLQVARCRGSARARHLAAIAVRVLHVFSSFCSTREWEALCT